MHISEEQQNVSYKASSLFKNRLSDKSLAKKTSLNLTL